MLLQSRGRKILFDTGSHGDRQLLLERLGALGLTPQDIDTVFISHFHFDHALNAELFTDSELLISDVEYRYITTEGYLDTGDPYVPRSHAIVFRDRMTTITDGDRIADGIRAVLLPGHTPGNTGLVLEGLDTLLTGDAVKNGWEFVRGIAPAAFHSSEAALESYVQVKSIAKVVVPGHDRPFRILDCGEIEYLGQWSARVDSFGDPGRDAQIYVLP